MGTFGFFISVLLVIVIICGIAYALAFFIRKTKHDSSINILEQNSKKDVGQSEPVGTLPITTSVDEEKYDISSTDKAVQDIETLGKEINAPIAVETEQEPEVINIENENIIAITDDITNESLVEEKENDKVIGEEVAREPESVENKNVITPDDIESKPGVEENGSVTIKEALQEIEHQPFLIEGDQNNTPDLLEETRVKEPIKAPGRYPGARNQNSQKRESKSQRPKPEIVCWERGRQWILAVEVPKEFHNNGDVVITQNSSPLEKDSSREYCWCLTQAFGKVRVHSTETFEIDLGEDGENYLLFKLSGEGREGRLVKSKSPSSGDYLVVVPVDWKTNEIIVSQIHVGYQAYWHIFDIADNRKMVFSTSKGEKKIQSKAPMFRLIGSRADDASETMGTLFIENPPRIGAHDIADWNDVGAIIIGEIGGNKWRAEVPLALEEAAQNLPSQVLENQSGWYFLRFYNKHDELMESLDFRFVRGLKKIKIPRLQPFPEDRHEIVQVELTHESDFVIESANTDTSNILVKSTGNGTVLSIPPNPSYDKTRWRIGHSHNPLVEITILVERVWWSIGAKSEMPITWTDRFAPLTQEIFSASDAALWLRFPVQRWVKEVVVGFQREEARHYDVFVTEQTVCIPLKTEFEIRDLHRDYFLRVWLNCGGKQYEGTVIVVSGLRPDWVGHGRKRSAIAVAMMRKGAGKMEINGLPIMKYFKKAPPDVKVFWDRLCNLKSIPEILSRLDISFRVRGSSPDTKQQWKAVTHALAHALEKYKPELVSLLKDEGFGGMKVSQDEEEGLRDESN